MLRQHFQEELRQLKELGTEFAKAHPALAPMLQGPVGDPDVERLLEGVAFQNALLRQKLEDDFPELIQDLVQLLCPHYLRPIPATSLIAYTPADSLLGSRVIAAGATLSAIPVEGTSCQFKTCYEVEIHPLRLTHASFLHPSGAHPQIRLQFTLNGLPLSQWEPQALRLHLAGEYGEATYLYLLLSRHLRRIVISPVAGGRGVELPATSLTRVGFAENEQLIPYPSHAFQGFRLLQEYFLSPQKFLFLDLKGWERWVERGEGLRFEVVFELEEIPAGTPHVSRESVVLFATPVINLFPHEADPISLDHRAPQCLVHPRGPNQSHYQIYSVDSVTGYLRGTGKERLYAPFSLFRPGSSETPSYHTTLRRSALNEWYDTYLDISYPNGSIPEQETLGLELTCTNGNLPDKLRIGDISLHTPDSPEWATFQNIAPITAAVLPPVEESILWRLTSHLSLNAIYLEKASHLRSLLELYLFDGKRNSYEVAAGRRRIAGIEDLRCVAADRLHRGVLLRGWDLHLKMRQDHFAGAGDMFLFGCVLDHFLGGYASMNSFTRLILTEAVKGGNYLWPMRLGRNTI